MIWSCERLKPREWKGQYVRYVQRKVDGHRVTIFGQHGQAWAVGREQNITSKLEHLDWWRSIRDALPYMTAIDGELVVPGGTCSDVAHALANEGDLQFVPFAIPFNAGMDLRWREFPDMMCLLGELVNRHGLAPVASWSELKPYASWEDERDRLIAEARANGEEGFVLKAGHYHDWFKVKVTDTVDCVVTGLKPGRGKYAGMCGALICSVYKDGDLVEIASASGMNDALREQISDADIGRVVELEYQRIGANGRLVHPRFVRWRDDKPREECVL